MSWWKRISCNLSLDSLAMLNFCTTNWSWMVTLWVLQPPLLSLSMMIGSSAVWLWTLITESPSTSKLMSGISAECPGRLLWARSVRVPRTMDMTSLKSEKDSMNQVKMINVRESWSRDLDIWTCLIGWLLTLSWFKWGGKVVFLCPATSCANSGCSGPNCSSDSSKRWALVLADRKSVV